MNRWFKNNTMQNTEEYHSIVLAGDLFPSGKNISLFEEGNVDLLFGARIVDLFHKADFSFFNLEGTLTSSNNSQEKTGPVIKASEKCIIGIKNLGVNAVMLANNHITDYQKEGFVDTIKLLNKNEIQYVGAGENKVSIKKSISVEIGEKKVCIYNVSELFYNQATTTSPGTNIYDEYVVCNEIKELKQSHDYLIVIYHGGAEEFPYPTPMLREHFHRMVDCGADFITAQHTHCIGCFEWYKGAYLLYGQGNFLFARMKKDMTKHGLITEIVFSKSGVDIIQHVVSVTSDDVVRYDEPQDLTLFNRRSDELKDDVMIQKKYHQFCYESAIIKDRFLDSFRGDSIYYRLIKKLPGNLYKKHLMEKYNLEQLMRISKCMESERYAENMFACVQYMMENNM